MACSSYAVLPDMSIAPLMVVILAQADDQGEQFHQILSASFKQTAVDWMSCTFSMLIMSTLIFSSAQGISNTGQSISTVSLVNGYL